MQRDDDLNEELQAHVEIEIQQLMEQRGCSREEEAFGNQTQQLS